MKGLRLGSWAAGLAFLFLQLGQVQGSYILTDLNSGGGQGMAYAINNSGQVVGKTYDLTDYKWKAAKYEPTGTGFIPLGTSGGGSSTAWDINDEGKIVGSEEGSDSQTRAILFNGSFPGYNLPLGDLGGKESQAYGINNKGEIVGVCKRPDGTFSAVKFTHGAEGYSITPLSDVLYSQALAINNDGLIVGEATTILNSYPLHAVRFTPAGGMNDLAPNQGESHALGINNGSIIVGYGLDNSGYYRATRFGPEGKGNTYLTPEGQSSMAYAINDKEQIVGWAMNSNGDFRATFFDQNENIDLNSVVDNWDAFENHNLYTLICARDINNWGQIVGYMNTPFGTHAFLLTPNPEPSSLLLMTGMGWSFLNRKRRT